MSYIKRKVFSEIQELLNLFPCVVILGARQVGKSTLLKQLVPEAAYFDLEREQDRTRILDDIEFFISTQKKPIVFDEAQLAPALFSALRVEIDKNREQCGQFILSGSSSPELLSNISESLAGRVAIFELGGFSLSESWCDSPSSLYQLIEQKKWEDIPNLQSRYTNDQLYEFCLFGSYPEPFLKRSNQKFFDLWMRNYFKTYIERDVRNLFPNLQLEKFRRFIRMLSISNGQSINYSNFAKSLDLSQPTIKSYFEIAQGTFLWRSILSFQKNLGKRLVKMPKGYLRDTGLNSWMYQIDSKEALLSNPNFGSIWESMIIEQIIKSFQNQLIDNQYYYYRTQNQAEIDLVIEGKFGLIPIEIKAGKNINLKRVNTLQKFIEDYKCPIGFLINLGDEIYPLRKNVIQLPANFL